MAGHLAETILEQLAEDTLPAAEAADVALHLERCGRCAAELEGHRALYGMLSELPRFAPSPDFADAVMARVRIAPRTSPVVAWLTRWLPTTRRGWAVLAAALVAPAVPVVALLAWLLSLPLVSPTGLWQWATGELRGLLGAAFGTLLDSDTATGLAGWAQAAWGLVSSTPAGMLAGVAVLLAVAIPLSAWSLVRLVRTPMGRVNYAN